MKSLVILSEEVSEYLLSIQYMIISFMIFSGGGLLVFNRCSYFTKNITLPEVLGVSFNNPALFCLALPLALMMACHYLRIFSAQVTAPTSTRSFLAASLTVCQQHQLFAGFEFYSYL